jgi:hypothetical protein
MWPDRRLVDLLGIEHMLAPCQWLISERSSDCRFLPPYLER